MCKVLLSAAVLLTFTACNGVGKLDEVGLRAFVQDEENGLKQLKTDGVFKVTATYRPSDLIAKQQMNGDQAAEFDSLANVYSRYTYFVVDITKNGKDLETALASEGSDVSSRINYLSSQFSEKFHVAVGNKLVPVTEFIYARSYGITGSQFLIAFENIPMTDFQLLINGRELGFNELTFDFEKDYIKRLPRLQF